MRNLEILNQSVLEKWHCKSGQGWYLREVKGTYGKGEWKWLVHSCHGG